MNEEQKTMRKGDLAGVWRIRKHAADEALTDSTYKHVVQTVGLLNRARGMKGFVIVPVKSFKMIERMQREGNALVRGMVVIRRG